MGEYQNDIFRNVEGAVPYKIANKIQKGGIATAFYSIQLKLPSSFAFDCFYEEILRPWDYAAGAVIIEEAGGKITDLEGNKVSFEKSRGILASNGFTHDELMRLTKE